MAVHQQKSVILPRLLGLRDHSPFILLLDTVAQSSRFLELELFHRVPKDANIIYLSYETSRIPDRANHTILCSKKSNTEIHDDVNKILEHSSSMYHISYFFYHLLTLAENVLFIDSLAYIDPEQLTSFLIPLLGPRTSVIATYHTDIPSKAQSTNSSYPSALALLSYFATAVLTISPVPKDDVNDESERTRLVQQFILPAASCNQPTFHVLLTHRRRSGRAIEASYIVNAKSHEIEYLIQKQPEEVLGASAAEEQELLKGLTTFNLTTTDKQKEAKDKVDLPFLQAQEVGFGGVNGGAIIYEFEKDDDYDEDDPYEDPF